MTVDLQATGRIGTGAYQALREALPQVAWYKRNFERFLRTALREHPELLDALDFAGPKRAVADAVWRPDGAANRPRVTSSTSSPPRSGARARTRWASSSA